MLGAHFAGQLRAALKPASTYAGLGFFTSNALGRSSSTTSHVKRFMVRQPNPMAQREVPTPLVFLSATEWDKTAPTDDETGGFTAWSAMYSSRGYTCVECDLKPPSPLPETSAELMQHFVTQLSQQVRLTGIPFPPVILSRSYTTLIAQAYISDHPCSALFLLSPPTPSADTHAYEPSAAPAGMLPSSLPEFDYEPYFNIGVMLTGAESEKGFEGTSRLGRDDGGKVQILRADGDVDGSGNESSRLEVERWMDRIGI